MGKRRDQRYKKNAAKAPTWVQDIVASKCKPKDLTAYRRRRLGKMGAAGPVVIIDPHTGAPRDNG